MSTIAYITKIKQFILKLKSIIQYQNSTTVLSSTRLGTPALGRHVIRQFVAPGVSGMVTLIGLDNQGAAALPG